LASDLKDVLYRTRTLGLWKCAALKAVSQPDESAGDFRARLAHQAREKRDAEVEKLRAQYAPKLAGLQEQVRKAGQRVEKSKAMASQQTLQTVVSVGSSILGALFGRKLASSANVTRAAGTVRAAGQAARRKAEVGHAEDTVEAIQQRLDDLDAELKDKVEKLQGQFLPDQLALEEVRIKPKRTEIEVQRVALAWTPWRQGADGHATPAYNAEEKGSG
jgi:TolA-binding protein